MVLVISENQNPKKGGRSSGEVLQYADCFSEGQTFRDMCINLNRRCHARHIYEQKPVGLGGKIWEKFRENVLHIFILEPRIIGYVIDSLALFL